MEQTILTAISTVGFPIVVTFYLLTRFQKSMDECTKALTDLTKELRQKDRRGCPREKKSSTLAGLLLFVSNTESETSILYPFRKGRPLMRAALLVGSGAAV